jgi:hypothetical protein
MPERNHANVIGHEKESFWVIVHISGMLKKRASRMAICVIVVAIKATSCTVRQEQDQPGRESPERSGIPVNVVLGGILR